MNLSVKDTAKLLNVSEKTVYRWIAQGALPVYRVSHQYRFNRADLFEWASSNREESAVAILNEPEVLSPPAFLEAFEEGGVFYRVLGKDKLSVLQNIVALLRLPEGLERDFVLQSLLAREELGATGIGKGIAIPHPRNCMANVVRPMVALFFLEKPVKYGALDGEPVKMLFVVIGPTMREHVFLLSKLAFMLDRPEFRRVLDRQGNRDEIFMGAQKAISLLCLPKTYSLSKG